MREMMAHLIERRYCHSLVLQAKLQEFIYRDHIKLLNLTLGYMMCMDQDLVAALVADIDNIWNLAIRQAATDPDNPECRGPHGGFAGVSYTGMAKVLETNFTSCPWTYGELIEMPNWEKSYTAHVCELIIKLPEY
jgi:hypothetical protein